MRNISTIRHCYGCGVCASSCPKRIIEIRLDNDGFYAPAIDDNYSCINCGVCLDVCSYNHPENAVDLQPLKSWAAWSTDRRVQRKCSSGGAGFEICKNLIENGYKVIACRYNAEKNRAEHYIAETVEELVASIGSKYIQSYTVDALNHIDRKRKYLVVGTPCQIDSFRRYVRRFKCEDNFLLIDFFCHCVPSMYAWEAYSRMQEKKVGKITYASWRNKFEYGWHDSWLMGMDGENTSKPIDWHDSYDMLIMEKKSFIQSRKSQGDLFYKLFLGDVCLGPQCENACRFKYDKSSADIRIGDLWGKTYQDNEDGVSALIAFTNMGKKIIENINSLSLTEHPFEVVAEGQMKKNAKHKEITPVIMYLLKKNVALDGMAFKITFLTQRIITKLKHLL